MIAIIACSEEEIPILNTAESEILDVPILTVESKGAFTCQSFTIG